MDILCDVFMWFLYSTLMASAVALVVLAVQKLFQSRLTARIQHVLWLIVLLRLIVPDFPNSPVSMFHVLQSVTDIKKAASVIFPFDDASSPKEFTQNSQEKKIPTKNDTTTAEKNHLLSTAVPLDDVPKSEPLTAERYSLGWQIIATVWLAGALTIVAYLLQFMWKLNRRASTFTLVDDPHILSVLDDCRKKFGIKKPIPVYTGAIWKSPHIFGLIRPRIYVPKAICLELSRSHLTHIFAHELAHLKRRDHIWNALGSFVLALHWINPLVWMCIKRMKTDRELACDAYALEVLGEAEAVPYGMTILECVAFFSAKPAHPHLLSFFGSNSQNELKRRITMIKSFKKGSYKLSALAVICVACLGATALTNAATPATVSSPAESKATGKSRPLFDTAYPSYNNLEKAVKVADFTFKAPDVLPDGYKFVSALLSPKNPGDKTLTKATLHFVKYEGKTAEGRDILAASFSLSAENGATGLEATYQAIEQAAKNPGENQKPASNLDIKKATLHMKGTEVLKVTVNKDGFEDRYYIWQDNGVQYQIEEHLGTVGSNPLTEQNVSSLVSSMKIPDQKMNERYKAGDMFITPIYDAEDFQNVTEPLGFTPKLPLQLLGKFKAVEAYVTKKTNFSYTENGQDFEKKTIGIQYNSMDKQTKGIKGFSLYQIKDSSIFAEIKKNRSVDFSRIDGEKFAVKVNGLTLGGKEVFKTVKYKGDGPLSRPQDPDYESYFWAENDVIFKVTFTENEPGQNEIVTALIQEKPVDFKNWDRR